MPGHTLRRLKGQFTITDCCYACRIGCLNLPAVFGAVDCILSNSSLLSRLRMSRNVTLPCLHNCTACRAADLRFAVYHCLLSRRRRRLLFPNLLTPSERWNSCFGTSLSMKRNTTDLCPQLQCSLILSK